MNKLNIAFVWHFHQPNYQYNYDSDFLLPWTRLHATKDYLDMLKKVDKFQNLKLNFDFSPVLLSALQKYLKGAKDIHLKLFLKDENELSEEDKIFILNNYFDVNYKNMVLTKQYFCELYNKRANSKEFNVNMFSNSEYSDIMANFTLLWIDKTFVSDYPDLLALFEKEINYTLQDRRRIYEIQLDIIRRILEEYKIYQDNGKIEVSTSPYYHPIIPLLLDFKGKEIKNFENLPNNVNFSSDASWHVEHAIKKYHEIFGRKPNGMWLSEQCVCQKTTELLSDFGINWTILDEGILSKTIKKQFIRDFEGNLENPFDLDINYKTRSKKPINILFSDSFFANLLNFGYGNYDAKIAANDMYDKIKIVQSKLASSPCENHILTIALDGENCWETYQNDGNDFLEYLYGLIDKDESLKTVLVNDFVNSTKPQMLDNLKSGSWIKRNFDLWIGEPVKNVAWLYMNSVNKDLEKFSHSVKKIKDCEEKRILEEKIAKAKREILIAQGSDWYWWYGFPNESKSDGVFDFLFRQHLIQVYQILNLEVPQYLTIPLANATTRPLRTPSVPISPSLSCEYRDVIEWQDAGYIFIPDSPTSNLARLIKNIHFGYDEENLYFRFEINKNAAKMQYGGIENQIAIYFINEKSSNFSSIRFINKNDNIYPIIKNQFSNEVRFVFDKEQISKIYFSKAISHNLWNYVVARNSKIGYKDTIELKIAFCDLGINSSHISFCVIDATNELINEVYPQDVLINL